MTAESLRCHSKFCYSIPTNSVLFHILLSDHSLFSAHTPPLQFWSLHSPLSLSLHHPLLTPGPRWHLPGALAFSHGSPCCSPHVGGEALWPTSISVTCQDLWVMESEPDRSESVLLKPTPGPLWDIMDEHLCPSPPLPYALISFHISSPTLCTPPFISHPSAHQSSLLPWPSCLILVIHLNLMEIWLPKINEAGSLKEIFKRTFTNIHRHKLITQCRV